MRFFFFVNSVSFLWYLHMVHKRSVNNIERPHFVQILFVKLRRRKTLLLCADFFILLLGIKNHIWILIYWDRSDGQKSFPLFIPWVWFASPKGDVSVGNRDIISKNILRVSYCPPNEKEKKNKKNRNDTLKPHYSLCVLVSLWLLQHFSYQVKSFVLRFFFNFFFFISICVWVFF